MNPALQPYIYLIINLGSLAIPLAYSFESKIQFFRKWKYLFPAMLLTLLFFIIWDIIFTDWGVWGFNSRYLTGIYLFNLPLEEWMFFVCIPYACVFTYEALKHFIQSDILKSRANQISWFLVVTLGLLGLVFYQKAYTATTFLMLAVFLAWHQSLKVNYMGRFYLAFLVILIPFFMVNGLLTGSLIPQEVVWYNDQENLGIRMFTIPVEDTFYGLLLILMNVTFFEFFRKHGYRSFSRK